MSDSDENLNIFEEDEYFDTEEDKSLNEKFSFKSKYFKSHRYAKYYKFLQELCPDIAKIFDLFIPITKQDFICNGIKHRQKCLRLAESLEGRFFAIFGEIQSGKSNFMIVCSLYFLTLGYSSVIVLRNNRADQEQIKKRFLDLETKIKKYRQKFQIQTVHEIPQSPDNHARIYLSLGNAKSMQKILADISQKFVLFIDEVDSVDSGRDSYKSVIIPELKELASIKFGVSATLTDTLIRSENNVLLTDVILLTTPLNYRGLADIQIENISESSKFTGKKSADLFLSDPELLTYVDNFSKKKIIKFVSSKTHPRISLINICRTKDPCYEFQDEITLIYPKIDFLVYNADGITMVKNSRKKFFKGTISECLQSLKNKKKSTHIIIIACELAGRGISFVSSDYCWHLTEERLLVSKKCDQSEIQQKIRLCGVYNDRIPLKLYITKSLEKDINKAYLLQQEFLAHIRCVANETEANLKNCREYISNLTFNKNKICKRPLIKACDSEFEINKVDGEDTGTSCGWTLDVYSKRSLPPPEFYEMKGLSIPDYTEIKNNTRESFYCVNLEKIPKDTLMMKIILKTIKEIISRKLVGYDLKRIETVKWLMESDLEIFKSQGSLNGSWDTNILPKLKTEITLDKSKPGLLVWKEDKSFYVRYN